MLYPKAKYVVTGQVFGTDVEVTIRVRGAANALPALTADGSLSVTDVQNVLTMFVTGNSKVLAQLQALDETGINPFRQQAEPSAPEGSRPNNVVNMSEFLKGKES